jgi:hypothetical protein
MNVEFEFDGRQRSVDIDAVTLEQAFVIKDSTTCGEAPHGMNLKQFAEGVNEANPFALRCVYWLMLQQEGTVCPIRGLEFPIVQFQNAFVTAIKEMDEADKAREAAEAEADDDEPVPVPTAAPSPERNSRPTTTRRSTQHAPAAV